MDLEELKTRIEAEALRRQAARDGFTLEAVEGYLGRALVLPPELRPAPPSPVPDPPTYAYFAALHGRDLVRSCYSVLLGRAPDAEGQEHFVKQLAMGGDKAMVIGSIAYSSEARSRNVRVAGLFPRFALAAAKRVPVAGGVVAWILAFATLHIREREQRALEHRVNERLEALVKYVAESSSQIASRIEALRSVMEDRD